MLVGNNASNSALSAFESVSSRTGYRPNALCTFHAALLIAHACLNEQLIRIPQDRRELLCVQCSVIRANTQ